MKSGFFSDRFEILFGLKIFTPQFISKGYCLIRSII